MDQMQAKLDQLAGVRIDNKVKQQEIRDHICSMLEKVKDQIIRLTDEQEQNRLAALDARQHQQDVQELLNQQIQDTQDKIKDQHQKELDQQVMLRQKIEDQQQRMEDQRAQQNL